jgi:2-keto-4-pentenoate hydratase/2-oxohepta-3-ene-1,7-dioic acid hydratase in catechol pathway
VKTATIQGFSEPIPVGKILCIGRNYAEHAKEMKADLPTVPMFFLKPSTALIASGEEIVIPPISADVHHEVEMTVLIGRGGKDIPREDALAHVAGYGIGLDMTLRDVQAEAKKKGQPWTLAKGFDTSAPVSEFLPARSVPDPHSLRVQLAVNGTVRQAASTGDVIFRVDALIAYLSRFITLERGDIIFTGTPEGVAQVRSGDRLDASLLLPSGAPLASLSVSVH